MLDDPLRNVLVNIERSIQAMNRDAQYLSGINAVTLPLLQDIPADMADCRIGSGMRGQNDVQRKTSSQQSLRFTQIMPQISEPVRRIPMW